MTKVFFKKIKKKKKKKKKYLKKRENINILKIFYFSK